MKFIEKNKGIIELVIKVIFVICLMTIASNLAQIKSELNSIKYTIDSQELSGKLRVSITEPVEVKNPVGRCTDKGFCWKDTFAISN